MHKKLIKQNYYEAVNEEWLKNAVIPGDRPAISSFLDLHLDIEKKLLELASNWLEDQSDLNENLQKFINLYLMTKDFSKRQELGTKPIQAVLEKIGRLENLKDLQKEYKDLVYNSIDTPFYFSVMQDFMNSDNQVLYFGASSLILPDTSYYKDEATKERMLGLFTATTTQLLGLYGYEADEINELIQDAITFDALLVPVTKSSVEKADYVKMYNPYLKEDILKLTKHYNLIQSAEELVDQKVDQLIITNPDFINAFNDIITDSNFKIMKSWMLVNNLISFSSHLTDEIRIAGGAFTRALSGVREAQSQDKFAFYQAYNPFSQVVGLYYGETFFGPVARENVKTMVHEMMGVYQERIHNNTWLQEETKERAIKKVAALTVHVGYPDELPPYYDQFEIGSYEEGSDLIQEKMKRDRLMAAYTYSKYNQKPNKNIWGMPASMVNAYYSPTNNQIVFPAAILQRPFYSLDQTSSENYGGIGAVMAHEISHAFDNNGAKFDETGSLNNWWTEEDLAAFDNKAKEMIALFDGVETGFGPCNGTLTVSENIADSGGLRCALEASKKSDLHNDEEFFMNWTRVWRIKASDEYSKLLLTIDVHGPSILRANMQLMNLPEFQALYQLTEEDPMFLAADKMVSIW